MGRYILKRILQMVPVFIGVSLIVFCICGSNYDPIIYRVGGEDLTDAQYEEIKTELGFDRPILVRYVEYLGGMVRGDLGKSHITGNDVFSTITEKLPITAKLTFYSVLVGVLISIPLGIISALKHGSITDNVSAVVALLGLSIPNFWLGLMLIIFFSLQLGWFPSGGYKDGILSMVLPAITVGTGLTANLTRQTRSSMLDVIRQEYLRTARAKGVSERRVILYHALRNALIPIITVVGAQIAAALAGSTLTETVFSLPGIGRMMVNAVNDSDVNMITGAVTTQSIITALVLLIVDLLYALVDPRIKAQFAKGGKTRG